MFKTVYLYGGPCHGETCSVAQLSDVVARREALQVDGAWHNLLHYYTEKEGSFVNSFPVFTFKETVEFF